MLDSSNSNNENITSNISGYRKLTQKRLEDTRAKYFKDVLQENGVIFSRNDRPHILTKEQSLIIRDIEKTLTQGNEDRVSRFLTGFKSYSKTNGLFHTSLLPTNLKKVTDNENVDDNDDDAIQNSVQQDSLIRIFFQINCLQNEMLEFILEEATEQVSEESENMPDFKLILNAMKYLPFINASDVLTQKLLDMLDVGTFGAQLEILNSIPEIIPDSQYESTAKQLSRVLENNSELTGAIIDCLNTLNLSSDTRLEIQDYIIKQLISSASIDIFPVLFEFLTSDCNPMNLPSVILKCRDTLNEIMRNESTDKEKETKKVVIMNRLQILATSKVLYEGWMNLYINITNFKTSHKPVDIIILVMLHSTGTNRKRGIETLIKRRVRTGLLKKQHLEIVFQKYFIKQLFCDYFDSILEIASALLKNTTDFVSTEFARDIFTLLFQNDNIDRIQRQDILHTLILLTSGWEAKCVGDILKILLDLSKGNRLKHHVNQLMGLLEKVDSFELKDIKQVYELLCFMAYIDTNEATSRLKDELHMLIRKQLSSAKRHLKQRGIIAAVVMAKHVATTSEEQEALDEDDSLTNIADLPNGPPQESACLLDLASNTASTIPELMGLYYDQLTSMLIKASDLDKYFMKWLQETVQQEFESTYTVKEVTQTINGVSFSSQYCLNEASEVEEGFSINIGGLTMGSSYTKSITLLAPQFRLFRVLCNKNQGNLDLIDALLGCGVVLPDLDDIPSYNTEELGQVANSIFHCINWFREIISAFVTQKHRKLRTRLIKRLEQLVELEDMLRKCLEQIPNHKLPSSYFYNILSTAVKGSPTKTKSEAKISRPRKKMKSNAGEAIDFLNETVASTTTQVSQRKKAPTSTSKRSGHLVFKLDFREIDTDLIILLKYPLKYTNIGITLSPQSTIDIVAFQYILNDVVNKLSVIVNNKDLGLSNLNDINPVYLIKDCIKFAPRVFGNFVDISKEIAKLVENIDDENNHIDLYTQDAKILKNSFCLATEYFMLLFSWKGFENPKNQPLLKDCLKSLMDEGTLSQSVTYLSRDFANKLISCADQCLHLKSAINLVKTMHALLKVNPENVEIKKKIATISGKFLNQPWYNTSGDLDSGKTMYENIDVLIKAYLNGANVKTISGIVATLQEQAGDLKTKKDYLEMMESINKMSFHVLYRNLCSYTLERVKTEINSLTNKQHLELWRTTGTIMQGLMKILNSQNSKMNYIIFLRKSIGILKIFLSHGMPILEIVLKSKTDEVIEILKTLQITTRFLHHLCCTSKLNKDATIVTYTPQFKQTLETLMFHVKAALVVNNCTEAFWMGTLKNKDLDGEEILTQTTISSDAGDEEDEELPPEDSDEEILEQEETVRNDERSASEVFD